MFCKSIIYRNGHRVSSNSIPCCLHVAVAGIGMPVPCHSVIWYGGIESQSTFLYMSVSISRASTYDLLKLLLVGTCEM